MSLEAAATHPPATATLWASRTQFFCSGFIFATWGVHIPTVKAHYGIDEAQLGFAMLAAGCGALLGLTRAGGWIGRRGARHMAGLTGVIYALLLAGLILMPGFVALLVLLAASVLIATSNTLVTTPKAASRTSSATKPGIRVRPASSRA